MLHLHRQLEAAGGRLAIVNVNPDIRRVLEITCLCGVLAVFGARDEAVHHLLAA